MEDEQGEIQTLSMSELHLRWLSRDYVLDEDSLAGGNPFYLATARDISTYPESVQESARYRFRYVSRLGDNPIFTPKEIKKVISKLSAEFNDDSPPAPITLWRWWRRYSITRSIICLVDGRERAGARRNEAGYLHFVEVIYAEYLTDQRLPKINVSEKVKKRIEAANSSLEPDKQVKCPSQSTIFRWLTGLEQYLVDEARLGKRATAKKYRWVKALLQVSGILDRVEIDHTPLDLLVIDIETNLVLGRPWITLAIDRFSRVILGFYIAFHAPSSYSVMECLRHAILPKDEWMSRFPEITGDWPMHGLMVNVVTDNGMDLHAEAVRQICYDMGITVTYCPAGTPQYKGAIERFILTFNKQFVHQLPGTTFSNYLELGDYPAEIKAAIDMNNLAMLTTKWITEVHLRDQHEGLHGRTPYYVWQEDAEKRRIELPAFPDQLRVLLGIPVQRTIFHYGVEVDGIQYNSEQLQSIIRHTGKREKINLKYYEEDAGYINVFNPIEEIYIQVNAIDQEYAQGLPRHLHRLIRAQLRQKGIAEASKSELAVAKQEIEEIVKQLVRDKKMRSRKNSAVSRRVDSNGNGGKPVGTLAIPAEPSKAEPEMEDLSDSDELPDFPVKE